MTELDDDRLSALIREAHQDTHLAVPLARITAGRARRRPAVAVLAAVAALVCVVAIGTAWLLLGGGDPHGLEPGRPSQPAPQGPDALGKPPRPTTAATTPQGKCADYAAPELAAAQLSVLPPLRFEVELIPGELRLLVYADAAGSTACWLGREQQSVEVNLSMLTTVMNPTHPPGRLTNVSSAWGRQPPAAYTFGRVPAGTTSVQVHFPGGVTRDARVVGEWYLFAAAGDASGPFSEITEITAVTPAGPRSLPVEHG